MEEITIELTIPAIGTINDPPTSANNSEYKEEVPTQYHTLPTPYAHILGPFISVYSVPLIFYARADALPVIFYSRPDTLPVVFYAGGARRWMLVSTGGATRLPDIRPTIAHPTWHTHETDKTTITRPLTIPVIGTLADTET